MKVLSNFSNGERTRWLQESCRETLRWSPQQYWNASANRKSYGRVIGRCPLIVPKFLIFSPSFLYLCLCKRAFVSVFSSAAPPTHLTLYSHIYLILLQKKQKKKKLFALNKIRYLYRTTVMLCIWFTTTWHDTQNILRRRKAFLSYSYN